MVYYMVANIVLLIVAGRVIYYWNSTTIDLNCQESLKPSIEVRYFI